MVSGGQSGQAVGTLRDAQPGLVLACRYGDCKRQRGAVQDQREPRRSEAGVGRIVCSRRLFFLSRLRRNAARVTGLAANGPANGQSGRKGRKGHCRRRDCTGTREEAGRGTGREENLEGKKGKMRRQLNGHQKLVRRLALSSRRQT